MREGELYKRKPRSVEPAGFAQPLIDFLRVEVSVRLRAHTHRPAMMAVMMVMRVAETERHSLQTS